jgi:hypothetical protein
MPIPIKTAAEFRRLLTTLTDELVDANIHWQLYSDLALAGSKYPKEFNQARTFWGLTVSAHLDAALFRLCKIYDQHRDGLNLRSFLETVQLNHSVFTIRNFRERLKGNLYVDSLAADARQPDAAQLSADIAYASKDTNPAVKTLVDLRNKLFAHRAPKEVIEATDLSAKYPLTPAAAEQLLQRGIEIANRYGQLFHAQTASTKIIGHDDYHSVIDAVRSDLERRDRKLAREQRRIESLMGAAGPVKP